MTAPASCDISTTANLDWIRMPSGTTIPLQTARVSRRTIAALLEQRVTAPGTPLKREELAVRVWNKSSPSHNDRLRMVIRRLLCAGLDEVLIHLDSGFLLNPTIPLTGYVARAAAPERRRPKRATRKFEEAAAIASTRE